MGGGKKTLSGKSGFHDKGEGVVLNSQNLNESILMLVFCQWHGFGCDSMVVWFGCG